MRRIGQWTDVNMKLIKQLCLCWFFLSANLFAGSAYPLPQDVQKFIENADNCAHFSGEWDNALPKARQREIEQSVDKYCGSAKKQQRELMAKYKGERDIQQQLSAYEF